MEKFNYLLKDISIESPSGENIEYDVDFLALQEAVNGKPEVQYGSHIFEAELPDWSEVESLSLRLLSKSHDLRVAVYLSRSLLNREGFEGFAHCLDLIAKLLEQRWPSVYPELDRDEQDDPTERVNSLSALVDPVGMLVEIRNVPLVVSRVHGTFCLRDIENLAEDGSILANSATVSATSIDAIINDALDLAVTSHASLESALLCIGRIESLLSARVGEAFSIDFSALSRLLHRAASFLAKRTASAMRVDGHGESMNPHVGATEMPATSAAAAAPPSEIASPQDVIRALDQICAYYEQHEPSSPVSLVLGRARRLVGLSFMELLEDLAPDGLEAVRLVIGTRANGDEQSA
ncbi:type VI secretion system protein TssA [Burkholderia ubonensis]|uniref:type VI secretion system protein TssA n=1 Tax=Burkholderia ubonensis TaxID=101571 RepID=UPI00075D1ED3|nr:type VI secretion system protein TssA [Burkholderia ubonensis]KVQ26137.1 hypothetical protein WK00_01975 [Burkholderia ubonensis]